MAQRLRSRDVLTDTEMALVRRAQAVIAGVEPDNNHTVAAAAYDSAGRIVAGVNVYHFSGGPCAEPVAIGAAVADPDVELPLTTMVAVVADGGGVIPPCGRCRQMLYDYYPDMPCAQPVGQNYGEYTYFSPPTQAPLDIWTCLETEVLLNTPGMHNGLHRAWLNGALAVEKLNMRWRDSAILNLSSFQLSFSGNSSTDTHIWIDNVVVSTQRIGCLSTAIPPSPPTGLTAR